MHTRLSLLTVTALALTGCATASAVNQRQDPITVMIGNGSSLQYNKDVRVITNTASGTPASLWPKLNAVYSSLSLPVTSRDSADFALGAQNAQFNGRVGNVQMSSFIDCGTTAFGTLRSNAYHVWLTVATQLQPSASGTTVRTSVAARAQDPSSSTTAIQCGSTGALEARIAAALGAQ